MAQSLAPEVIVMDVMMPKALMDVRRAWKSPAGRSWNCCRTNWDAGADADGLDHRGCGRGCDRRRRGTVASQHMGHHGGIVGRCLDPQHHSIQAKTSGVHRLPNHISKMVLSIVKIGPLLPPGYRNAKEKEGMEMPKGDYPATGVIQIVRGGGAVTLRYVGVPAVSEEAEDEIQKAIDQFPDGRLRIPDKAI